MAPNAAAVVTVDHIYTTVHAVNVDRRQSEMPESPALIANRESRFGTAD